MSICGISNARKIELLSNMPLADLILLKIYTYSSQHIFSSTAHALSVLLKSGSISAALLRKQEPL